MKRDVLHIKAIVCNALRREFYMCAARSSNVVDVTLLPQGLHDQPDILRDAVRREMDVQPRREGTRKESCPVSVDADSPYDAVVLGYALCSNAIAGLEAGSCPLVVPRAHDCITLLLGARGKYSEYFKANPGTYWYSSGWIETCAMPGRARDEEKLKYFVENYGEENARYLMETEAEWFASYKRAAYIDWGFPNSAREKAFTKECADHLGWEYDELTGDPALIQRLLDADWDAEDFLVVAPGSRIEPDPASPGILRSSGVCKEAVKNA